MHINVLTQAVYMYGDFDLLEHAFSNILLNAAKYSPVSSSITIQINRVNDFVTVDFIDEGPGIPEQFMPYLFEPFYRVPGLKAEGLGLGLSIAKNLIDLHRGKIMARNNESQGATFTIEFPYLELPDEIKELSK